MMRLRPRNAVGFAAIHAACSSSNALSEKSSSSSVDASPTSPIVSSSELPV